MYAYFNSKRHNRFSLSNGPCNNQAKEQQATVIAAVIFQVLISLIKLNLNALIGHQGKKREIGILGMNLIVAKESFKQLFI